MEEDIQNYLPTVMFRGTPCTLYNGGFVPVSIKTPFFNFELCTLQKWGSANSIGRRLLRMPEASLIQLI